MTSKHNKKTESGDDSKKSVDTALLLDRFVSSSSAEDVSSSLDSILRGVQNGDISPDEINNEHDVINALLQVFQTSKYKNLPVEDSLPTVGRLFIELINKCNINGNKDAIRTLLMEPSPGRLLESAIDVASSATTGVYARVVSLQLLHVICKSNSRLAQQQLMQAPNGLHRLGDLLKSETVDGDTLVPEQVRNEALLLASNIAEWPSAAKVWMFNEVGDVVLQTAIKEGGLTGGNVLVLDCLKLLQNMLKHDAALADLVFQSPVVGPCLAQLLDLRNGFLFKNPPPVKTDITVASNVASNNDDDDLDALLASGKSAKKDKQQNQPPEIFVPYLKSSEEKIIEAVFDILAIALENENVKQMVWTKHIPLGSYIWEMGLITPPPPGSPYPCAVPSILLQQQALQTTALYFSDMTIMERHSGLDRLLYLVCTGGGDRASSTLTEKLQLQQSALYVIRKTLKPQVANQILLCTMIPEMVEDEARNSNDPFLPQRAQVVRKLLNTAYENLTASPNDVSTTINGTKQTGSMTSRKVFLSGSLGALSLFLVDEASRSIFLRITTNTGNDDGVDVKRPSLVDAILECLATQSEYVTDDSNDDGLFIALVLLRFLLSWMNEAPVVVQAVLSSPHAAALSTLYNSNKGNIAVGALVNCVLGICMVYIGDESQSGGWTVSNIMEMISKRGGVGKFTSLIEKLKSTNSSILPWSSCSLEWNVWMQWYDAIVLVVRKRVVQELTSTYTVDEEDDELKINDTHTFPSGHSHKSLQHLLTQQSNEIEELRKQLASSKLLNVSQEKQLSVWKQRVESTPNQLDELLSDLTTKNAELDHKVLTLNEEIQLLQEKQESELKSRDMSIEDIRKELKEIKIREEQVATENETLREEMTGLNQAYLSLEEEYRRQQNELASAVASTSPQNEASDDLAQSSGRGSTEVSALRAENARLLISMKAADDWIAMAMQRMQETDVQMNSLYQTIQELQTKCDTLESQSEDQQLQQERDMRVLLESNVATLTAQLNETVVANTELKRQLDTVRGESMERQAKLMLDHSNLEIQVKELEKDLEQAKAELETNRATTVAKDSGSNAEYVESLHRELQQLRHDIDNKTSLYQAMLSERDNQITELESKQSLSFDDNNAAPSANVEIAELRAANDEAQAWINQAVQHHQMLSDTLTQLSEENTQLRGQLQDLTNNQSTSSIMSSSDDTAKTIIANQHRELQELRTKISSLEQVNDRLGVVTEAHGQDVQDLQMKIEDRRATEAGNVSELHARISELVSVIEEVSSEKERILIEMTDSKAALEIVKAEHKALLQAGHEHQRLLQKIENLESQLSDQNVENNTLIKEYEDTYNTIVEEKEKVEDELKVAREAYADLLKQLDERNEQLASISAERSSCDDSTKDAPQTVELKAEVLNLQGQLKEQESQALEVVALWEESYAELELKLKESVESQRILHETIANLKQELEAAIANRQDKVLAMKDNAPSDEMQHSLREPNEKPHPSSTREEQLEAMALKLEEQLKEQESQALEVVTLWEQSYAELDMKLKESLQSQSILQQTILDLKQELATTTASQGNELDTKNNEIVKGTSSQQVSTETFDAAVKHLEEQLKEQEAQALEVVALWEQSYAELELKLNESVEQTTVKTKTFDAAVKDLEEQLKEQETQALEVVALWEQSYAELELKLNESVEKQTELEQTIVNLKEELEKTIFHHKQELDATVNEAEEAVSAWQDTCNNLTAQNMKLLDEVETGQMELAHLKQSVDAVQVTSATDWQTKLKDSLADSTGVRVEQIVESLDKEVARISKEAEETIYKWETRCRETGKAVMELESENKELQSQLDLLKEEKEHVLSQLSSLRESSQQSEQTFAEKEDKYRTLLEEKNETVEKLKESVTELQQQHSTDEEYFKTICNQWQTSYHAVEEELNNMVEKNRKRVLQLMDIVEYLNKPGFKDLMLDNHDQLSLVPNNESDLDVLLSYVEKAVSTLEGIVVMISEDRKARMDELHETKRLLQFANNALAEVGDEDIQVLIERLRKELTIEKASAKEADEHSKRIIDELQSRILSLTKENEEACGAANDARIALEYVQADARNYCDQLMMTIKEKDNQLRKQECSHEDSVEQWHLNYNDLERRLDEVTDEKENLRSELRKLQADIQDDKTNEKTQNIQEQDFSQSNEVGADDNLDVLQKKVQTLEEQREEDAEYFTDIVNQWQASYNALEGQVQDLENKNLLFADQVKICMEFMATLSAESRSLATELTEEETYADEEEVKHCDDSVLESVLDSLRKHFNILTNKVKARQEESHKLTELIIKLKENFSSDDINQVPNTTSDFDKLSILETLFLHFKQQFETLKLQSNEMEQRNKAIIQELELKIARLCEENDVFHNQIKDGHKTLDEQISDQGLSLLASAVESEVQLCSKENEALVGEMQSVEEDQEKPFPLYNDNSDPGSGRYIQSLQIQIKELENSIGEQGVMAEDVVQQWQNSYELLKAHYETLLLTKDELEAEIAEYKSIVASRDTNVEEIHFYPVGESVKADSSFDVDGLKRQLEDTEKQLMQVKQENEAIKQKNSRLESRVSVLLESSYQLDLELDALKEEKKQIQSSYDELMITKSDLEGLTSEVQLERNARQMAETRCAALEKQVMESESMFVSRLEKIVLEKDQKIESLASSNMISTEAYNKLECEVRDLNVERESLQTQVAKLNRHLAEYEHELQEANSAMQVYLTNRTIDNASQTASEALRQQLDELITQVEEYREIITTERSKREHYEQETERLRADLAAIVGIEHNESNLAEIQKYALVAAETLRCNERTEIASLKNALSRSQEELRIARAAEKQLEDRVVKANHEAIIYEQQVVACKDEFRFLTQTIEELRESETTRRASFEYRIASLENTIKLQRLDHTTEIENLRNELSQLGMERDRLFQALKESEKRRETLMNSVAASDAKGTTSSDIVSALKNELRKIQVEKSLLLSSCGDEASRFERRIREARAAERSAMESDVIYERELRFVAENTVEQMKQRVNELQHELEQYQTKTNMSINMEQLKNEYQQIKEQLQETTNENMILRMRLETTIKESQASIEQLQHEAKQTKARMVRLEHAGHFEAEVRYEQAKLLQKSSTTTPSPHNGRVVVNLAEEEKETRDHSSTEQHTIAVAKLYDYIQKQTQAIAEERSVYMELAVKNDELLAFIAQLDLLRTSLKDALIEHCGEHIWQTTIQNAEAKAQAEFGTVIKFV